jgi:hypothetical protein
MSQLEGFELIYSGWELLKVVIIVCILITMLRIQQILSGRRTKTWVAFMDKYYPNGDQTTTYTVWGYLFAQTLVEVLKQCGDDLTRENIMRQAANLHNLQLGMLLPGITLNTGPFDFAPIKQALLQHCEFYFPNRCPPRWRNARNQVAAPP